MLSRQRYVELGYQVAIFPATAFLAAGRGIESVYSHLKATGRDCPEIGYSRP